MTAIVPFLEDLGLSVRITDDEAYAKCPFHSPDYNPSFSVNTSSGVYYCFACGASGNLAHLVARLGGMSYTDAAIQVNIRIGWARAYKWKEDVEHVNLSPMAMKVTETDLYRFHSPSLSALESKNLTTESADKFQVLWNPERESWIFPFRDPYTNELWGWQEKNSERRLFRNFPQGTRKSKTLFGLPAFTDGSTAVIVESPVDACVLDAAGCTGGLSTFGVSASHHQFSLVQQRTDEIILAFDRDMPGITATRGWLPVLIGMFSKVYVYNYGESKAKDPGEQAREEIQWGISHKMTALEYLNQSARDFR